MAWKFGKTEAGHRTIRNLKTGEGIIFPVGAKLNEKMLTVLRSAEFTKQDISEIQSKLLGDERQANEKIGPNPNTLTPIPFSEIRKMKPTKDFIVKDFLNPGDSIMVFGEPACTKSLKSNLLALCVSTGKPFMEMKTKKGAVAIYDNENGITKIRERAMALFRGMGLRRSPKNFWVFSRDGNLDSPLAINQMIEFCKEKKIRLLILDTLRRCTNAEENSSSEINRFFQDVILPLQNIGVCVMFLHHSGKGKTSYRGSSDLMGFVDAAFSITKNCDKITIKCEKSRGAEPEKIVAEWAFETENDPQQIKLIRLDNVEEEQIDRLKKIEISNAIIQVFSNTDHLRRSEIIDLLEAQGHNFSLSSIKRSLKYLIVARELTRDSKSKYALIGQEKMQCIR